ncbi:MAG: FAD-binding oxidoreductase [Pseudonocardia sp.]
MPVLRPADLAELRTAVRDTTGPLAVAGAGTAAGWAGRLGPVDAVLDTTALAGVIVHNPGDMTVAVRAGTPLRELAAELAPHGQHVAVDAARVARGATVGGLVATADAGPGALVRGTMRDLVIGVTVVLADGTVARSGGHVIKNVAGYDLAKLLHGSYGAVAVLAEVVLRLHPVPRRSTTVAMPCSLAEAADHAAQVLASPLEATALEWCSGADGAGELLVRVEGTRDALPGRVARLRELLGPAADVAADTSPSERHVREDLAPERAVRGVGDGGVDGSEGPWERHAALVAGSAGRDPAAADPGHAVLRLGIRPARLADLVCELPAVTVTAGLGTGVATVTLPPDAVAAAHDLVHAAGGTSVLRERPPGCDAPAWGPPPSAVGMLRAVKQKFDPDGRLGPGRLSPWLDS